MKKKECPSCAMQIDDQSTTCPICSYEFPRQSRWVQWVAILLVLLMLLSLLR
ncbi:hypothetical protein GCM10027275_46600 [Rhabdobacter roseus]|uniref:RNA polymerase subunit RPABC4/transcription elongation factor Spt4 n=1 Tax=Rhabdobacter roseus TaxID=1655419 RepID=A0A840TU81_9BACT|nr:hypothetical protein [Rhabdobacter roseus]MBB5286465.1 RNA polymerase subunit RPABC4/transcription elongation factor Spt4 [Rhabdobacter roseus]